jgi:3-(3-hydroxy-phenyl)propionate hydroxylase
VARVIVVGGGPVGLSAALFLTDRGIDVTVLEAAPEPFPDPRAATYHPPTLEMLAPSGVTQMLHDRGIVADKWQNWDRGSGLIAEFDLAVLRNETTFPYRLQCEQHKLVEMLTQVLSTRPNFTLHRDSPVTAVTQSDDAVVAETADARFEADYLIGADGGRSVVRKSQAIAFEGFTYPEQFLVVTSDYNFAAEGFALSCYVADPEQWCALFKVPGKGPPGIWRTVFPTDPTDADETLLSFENARTWLDRFVPRAKPYEILHTNLYKVHQRVAATFHQNRVLLIGDAAHVNNPLGGMGMNFGIHDAENVGRAIAAAIDGDADALPLFNRQRRFASTTFLQTMTIQNKAALEDKDEASRRKRQDDLRRTALDPAAAKTYLMRTSMIEGLRAANAVT